MIHVRQAVLGKLLLLEVDGTERIAAKRSAVEEETHAAGLSRARAKEVDAHKPARIDDEAGLFLHLPLTGLPGAFAVGFHLPAGHCPSILVGGFEHEKKA